MLHVIICPQGSAVTGNSNGLQANSNGNGIQPKSDGLQPNTDGLQPTCDGLSFQDGRWVRFDACPVALAGTCRTGQAWPGGGPKCLGEQKFIGTVLFREETAEHGADGLSSCLNLKRPVQSSK